jgi:hypothetical protein
MRHSHCTLTPRQVRATATSVLATALHLTPGPAGLTAERLAELLAAAAAWTCSLIAAARRLIGFPSRESIRKALARSLPADHRALEQRINDGLHARLPARFGQRRRRGFCLAIDLHQRPYYGNRDTPGILNGAAHLGTKQFWTYATVAIVESGRRWTVALTAVDDNRLVPALDRLWGYLRPLGLPVRYVLVDRGFYAGPVIRWFQARNLAFLLPAVRRGRLASATRPATGTARFFAMTTNGTFTHTWKDRGKGEAVTVAITVVRVLARRPRGRSARRGRGRTLVYAHGGWPAGTAGRSLVRAYRKRFGIETSYRQLGQGLAASCSTDRRVRLLLVGVALILRNMWVWLVRCGLIDARGQPWGVIRLTDLLAILGDGLTHAYGTPLTALDH